MNARDGRRRSGCVRALFGAAMLAVLVGCGARVPAGETRDVVVPSGASLRTVADSLASAGLIRSSTLFRLYARVKDVDRVVQPGTYRVAGGAGYGEILAHLVAGDGLLVRVVIPEGFELRRIVPRLAAALSLPADSLWAAARDSAWRAEFAVPAETLEGYLFPATYEFPVGISARAVVRAMLDRFALVWTPALQARADSLGVTRHAAVTMASLVEAEARRAEERPLISAVYWNRVARGMRLQADPTVQYALPERVSRVLFVHLEIESPYNTYRVDGLPPGPIGSPGQSSLEAAVAPAPVPYLYFVAHPDGHHEFRTTFAEHQRAIAQVRRAARAGGSR